MSVPAAIVELPLPVRYARWGALALGAAGCVVGLVIGLDVHAATAWAATFEVGLPSAVLGALAGLAAGSVRLLAHRRSEDSR